MPALRQNFIVTIVSAVLLTVAAAQSSLQLAAQSDSNPRWPSLRFQFSIKRFATKVHGQAEFSVLANPILSIDNTSVLYNAFTTFEEDGMLYNYSLVDGVAYVSHSFVNFRDNHPSVKCMDTNILPPINSIVTALSDAKAVTTILASDGSVLPCSSGNTFKASVNGIEFGLCFSGSSGFTMYGSDMNIKVEYVGNHMPIQAPKLNGNTKIECKKVASSSVTSVGKSFLTGEKLSTDSARKLTASLEVSLEDVCTCKSEPRPCIFIHGLGVLTEEEENLETDTYWGNMTGHTPCCSSTKYAVLNTVNNSWTDGLQQQKVCDHILGVSETSKGTTVSDTIVISHSMGGLMVAGAIANGICSFDKSTTWVSTGSPMAGSMASDYFQESCMDQTNLFMEKFVENTGFCPADDGIKSLAYEHESYSNAELDEAYEAAQEAYRDNVYALMCSRSYSGILSSYQIGFWVLGSMVSHKSRKNDGMVEFHSCAGGIPASKFRKDYRHRFYAAKLNHYDVAFKAGDALMDKAKMPVKWFECLL